MPQRYIIIPDNIILKNPMTDEIAKNDDGVVEKFSFRLLLDRLLSNPKWTESFDNVRSAGSILKAFEETKDGVMLLAEDDWKKLEDTVKNPRQIINSKMGPQIQAGYGLHPSAAPQILPLLDAIVRASETDPRKTTETQATK